MKLCVLETDLTPESLLAEHGSYPSMIERWLSPYLAGTTTFSVASLIRDDALPAPTDYDGYLITGSGHGVYDKLPWMRALSGFLLQLREVRRPVFGICFGHQIMAEAYGGKVEKSGEGWLVGTQHYRNDEREGLASGQWFAFHQDQVVALPEGARRIAANARCANAALAYDFPALSVQYHPEFDEPFMTALLDMYEGGLLPDDLTQAARNSMVMGEVENAPVAEWVAAFFLRTSLVLRTVDHEC